MFRERSAAGSTTASSRPPPKPRPPPSSRTTMLLLPPLNVAGVRLAVSGGEAGPGTGPAVRGRRPGGCGDRHQTLKESVALRHAHAVEEDLRRIRGAHAE